ncbi:MAG: hypothetical protein RQ966_14770 [Acetobacteraceae bacterium]|nr:hypothetical protein [Acetobacteraceae bacterium]
MSYGDRVPVTDVEIKRRQRVRNVALLIVLICVSALFYAIAIVKFKTH